MSVIHTGQIQLKPDDTHICKDGETNPEYYEGDTKELDKLISGCRRITFFSSLLSKKMRNMQNLLLPY
jgi:hypothetical protein